ncbi:MAG: IS1 family transposase [Chloroflexota bacterium]|nr:IS1 family transposase [Chloroflexota bacterium]MDQ5865135.1 IS1 family transposase [Chloroflexota bacterium]
MQQYADELPQAHRYSSDQLAVYGDLLWPDTPEGEGSSHVISYGKEQTYTIESINADLRTYLGRLKRKSRCFPRSIEALRKSVRELFVCSSGSTTAEGVSTWLSLTSRVKGNLSLYY